MVNNLYSDKEARHSIPTVTIESVDGAIYDYYDKKVPISIEKEDSTTYKVPIFFAAGERWALIRKNNFRDGNGTLILPIVSIRRTNIERVENVMGGMTSAQRQIVVSKQIHPKTGNIQSLIDARKKRGVFFTPKSEPVFEIATIPYPDFCTISYEITIWTSFNTQMNEIIEKIFYNFENAGGRVDSFVMPLNYDGYKPKGDGFYFVGFIDGEFSKESNDEDFTNQERIIKYTYGVKVPAYLLLDPKDEALSYGNNEDGTKQLFKKQTANQVSLKEEIISLEDFEKLYG